MNALQCKGSSLERQQPHYSVIGFERCIETASSDFREIIVGQIPMCRILRTNGLPKQLFCECNYGTADVPIKDMTITAALQLK